MVAVVDSSKVDQRVDELIRAQAAKTPGAVAVTCGDETLTYAQLEARYEALATRLRALGVHGGSLVGLHLDRSIDMLVAVIAVMRAGGAYVPLDPEFPAERLAYMVQDSGLELVITHSWLASAAPTGTYRKLEIDRLGPPADGVPAPTAGNGAASASSDLIYVLYTSGSTGKPKGVALEHRNVVNFLLSMQQEPGLKPADRLLAVTTLSFDIAGLELFLPLVTGASLVIAGRDEAADGVRLRELLEKHSVTVMQATPTTWRLLVEAGWQGTPTFKALCGGEALPGDLARTLTGLCAEVWNMYGPTETAIWSTCFRVPAGGAPILIGKPIANTGIYVLDRSRRPVPTGIPGELYIAGAGVARGYLNRPELTSERFLTDPFSKAFGGRMYRTGDMGRYLPDGNLEFRARADNQVKVRGFRVELGEVESALTDHPRVKQAIGRVIELRPGDARLVAYVLANGEAPTAGELRDHLRTRLPQYMIPQHFVGVDAFPLTPNGKVDRAQLPHPQEAGTSLAESYTAPATDAERAVAAVFADVLEVERVSADASFFDLGGHSVLATRVIAQLRKREHPGITLRMLFDSPTVTDLARGIEALKVQATAASKESRVEIEEFQF